MEVRVVVQAANASYGHKELAYILEDYAGYLHPHQDNHGLRVQPGRLKA